MPKRPFSVPAALAALFILFVPAALASLFSAAPADAAGFDCAKAATTVEKTICADPELSGLDEALAALFRQNLAADARAETVRAGQRAWLKVRDACRDAACLNAAYQDRLAALRKDLEETRTRKEAARQGWEKRAALFARLKWPQECEDSFRERFADADLGDGQGVIGDGNGWGVEMHDLGGGERLALVQCDLSAYQPVFTVVFFHDGQDGPGRVVALREYDRDASGRVTVSETALSGGYATFDPANRTLTVFTKARGIGDCGSLATYAFDRGRAAPRQVRAQACFDDKRKWIADPKKWPLVTNP